MTHFRTAITTLALAATIGLFAAPGTALADRDGWRGGPPHGRGGWEGPRHGGWHGPRYAPPVYARPHYYAPPPVYYAPPQAYYAPPRAYYAPPPVYYAPAPVISFGFHLR